MYEKTPLLASRGAEGSKNPENKFKVTKRQSTASPAGKSQKQRRQSPQFQPSSKRPRKKLNSPSENRYTYGTLR